MNWKRISNEVTKICIASGLGLVVLVGGGRAQAIERAAFGPNPAAIQAAVIEFRQDLGPLNPNSGASFRTGRREVNWDNIPDSQSEPNSLAPDYLNATVRQGLVFSSTSGPIILGGQLQSMRVSAASSTNVPLRFGNINATYAAQFQTFSGERLFTTSPESNVLDIEFYVPGTTIRATVSGFGAVFTDVDTQSTRMQFYDDRGKILFVPNGGLVGQDRGLTFQGVSYQDGTRISRVRIILGNAPLGPLATDGVNGVDVVAVDDIIYGEPRALDYHEGDFDGDGAADIAVFRPSTGQWFVLDSGSNTFAFVNWGAPDDIPISGDFDGDRKNDFVIFRPSSGTWWRLNSSDGQVRAFAFGQAGDIPEFGDYDKDGKSDLAIFRPSEGNHWILRSSDGIATPIRWGAAGDIPISGR